MKKFKKCIFRICCFHFRFSITIINLIAVLMSIEMTITQLWSWRFLFSINQVVMIVYFLEIIWMRKLEFKKKNNVIFCSVLYKFGFKGINFNFLSFTNYLTVYMWLIFWQGKVFYWANLNYLFIKKEPDTSIFISKHNRTFINDIWSLIIVDFAS